jgi:hypothetical protein
MENLKSYGDSRLTQLCLYCRGIIETREHVPSKVLLDEPYPDNLPVVGACAKCNESFSLDEEYLACLIDCVLAGSENPALISRPKIARILREKPALRETFRRARQIVNGTTSFSIDHLRVRNVILKLARGHAMFELDMPLSEDGVSIEWIPLALMDADARSRFETPLTSSLFPEVGSRAAQRMAVISVTLASVEDPKKQIVQQLLVEPGWIDVQPGRYRYLATVVATGHTVVRMVLSEYLACEVIWKGDDNT